VKAVLESKNSPDPELPVQKLDMLGSLVAEKIGLHFPSSKRRDLWRAVYGMAREKGCPDPESYIDDLISSPTADRDVEALAIYLTVGETYFFRESNSIKALRHHILPGLIRERSKGRKTIRIWSAGCSTGEEPYTAAMLLDMLLPSRQGWDIQILGTDINNLALKKARAGIYSNWSFRGTSEALRSRYFIRAAQNRFAIKARIREMVSFEHLNLADDRLYLSGKFGGQDIILCRNVMIYLTPEMTKKVIRRFHRCLNQGGWLMVAPSEAFLLRDSRFTPVLLNGTTLYRKDGDKREKMVFNADPPQVPTPDFFSEPLSSEPVFSSPEPVLPAPSSRVFAHEEEEQDRLYNEALDSFKKGRRREARALLEGLLGKDDQAMKQSRVSTLMARVLADLGDLDKAEECCSMALETSKTDPELYHLMAMIRLEQGRERDAVRELKRSLYLDPDFIASHFILGSIALDNGRKSEASRYLQNAVALLDRIPEGNELPQLGDMSAGRLLEIISNMLSNGDLE
jgi:chemotaxis protein methyltransferase CheR